MTFLIASGSGTTSTGISRRAFVTRSSLLMAGTLVGGRRVWAFPRGTGRVIANLVAPPFPPELLRTAATTAIEAAIHAGAEWADIRVGEERTLSIFGHGGELQLGCGYSLRVRVGGAEAFVTGADPTIVDITTAAQRAVATAKSLVPTAAGTTDTLAKVPVVKGEWRVPMAIDPFAISIDDHVAAQVSSDGEFDRHLFRFQQLENGMAGASCRWKQGTKVFASSDGSLVTQYLTTVEPHAEVRLGWPWRAHPGEPFSLFGMKSVVPCSGGFEMITHPDRYAYMQARAEELLSYTALPAVPLEIGRQDVVLDGDLHGQLIGTVIVPTLSLNRALGNEIDVGGTSLFSPPESMRGQAVLPALLSCRAAPDAPHYGAAAWDDEGVATTPSPLIVDGVLTNYLASRATAAFHGERNVGPLPGITQSQLGALPTELPPCVAVAPANGASSIAELCKQMGNGILALSGYVSTDPSGLGGYIYPWMMLEVRQGTVTRRLYGQRMMYSTKRIFKTLTALGDAGTQYTAVCREFSPGVPWVNLTHAVSAPAALYHNIDIVPSHMQS